MTSHKWICVASCRCADCSVKDLLTWDLVNSCADIVTDERRRLQCCRHLHRNTIIGLPPSLSAGLTGRGPWITSVATWRQPNRRGPGCQLSPAPPPAPSTPWSSGRRWAGRCNCVIPIIGPQHSCLAAFCPRCADGIDSLRLQTENRDYFLYRIINWRAAAAAAILAARPPYNNNTNVSLGG